MIVGSMVLIIMPLIIIVNCIISSILAITSWLWIPFILALNFVFQLLIWDYDSPTGYALMGVVVGVVEIALSLIAAMIIHPVLCFLVIVMAIVRIVISMLTDLLFYGITRKIGR